VKELQKATLVQFNRNFAQSLLVDLEYSVDQSARSVIVGQSFHFSQALQLLHLLTSNQPAQFLNESVRTKTYNTLIDYSGLVTTLLKFKEERGFLSGFSLFQDEKQKQITSVVEWLQKRKD